VSSVSPDRHDVAIVVGDHGDSSVRVSPGVVRLPSRPTARAVNDVFDLVGADMVRRHLFHGVQAVAGDDARRRRLDGRGAIGIMRWAITGAVPRAPQPLCYQPGDPFAEQHTPDAGRYLLDHFFSKLLKLADGMTTATGRDLAEQRTAFMRVYLNEFRRELAVGPGSPPLQDEL